MDAGEYLYEACSVRREREGVKEGEEETEEISKLEAAECQW